VQRRSTSVTTAFASPSQRCRPVFRRVLLTLGVVFTAIVVSGCVGAPAPTDVADARATGGAEPWQCASLSADDRAFLDVAASRFSDARTTGATGPTGPQVRVYFSFTSWPGAREQVRAVFPETEKLVPRIDRGVAVFSAGQQTFFLETNVSRLVASVALNVEGWTRIGWGRWCDPDTGIGVTFLPDRRWLVTNACGRDEPDLRYVPAGIPRGTSFVELPLPADSKYATPGGTASRRIGVFAVVEDPDLAGIPERLQPLEMRFALYDDRNAEMVLTFPDERAARVALVPIRLRAETFLSSYGFVPGERFDIYRSEAWIGVIGVAIETLEFPETVLAAD
jgi:hypothetical protein